jgi:hypothetical protein
LVLNLIVGGFDSGSDGNIEDNILIYANTYNVTTFTDALNASISTRFSTEFPGKNPPTISYSTTTNKFTFTITGTLRIRIKDCTMKTILGFDTFDEVYDSFPIPPSSTSFESQFKVYYE